MVTAIADFKQAVLSPEQVQDIATHNISLILRISPIINELFSLYGRIPAKKQDAFQLFTDILKALNSSNEDLAIQAHSALEQALQAAQADNTTKPLTLWKNLWLHKNDNDQWTLTNGTHAYKLQSLARLYALYQEALRTSGLYDFNDMIMKTIETLKNQPDK